MKSNKRLYLKRTIYILAILATVFVLFYLYLPPSNGPIDKIDVTIGRDKLDVACIGSSHVFNGISPAQMFAESGIASYDIAGGSQAPWIDYYYIKAVNKHQHPKLMVLDVYVYTREDINSFAEGREAANLLNFPLSPDKIRALHASRVSRPLNVILKFPYTYDEYDRFVGMTFDKRKYAVDHGLGYKYESGNEVYEDVIDGKGINGSRPIDPTIEEYLRRSIEYCQDNSIEILLTNTPCPTIDKERYERFNYIKEIADEYDISFINGCLYMDEMGMDWSQDSYGYEGHMNYRGVRKYTHWLTEYISKNYELPDRRGDSEYSVYNIAWEELQNRIDSEP